MDIFDGVDNWGDVFRFLKLKRDDVVKLWAGMNFLVLIGGIYE